MCFVMSYACAFNEREILGNHLNVTDMDKTKTFYILYYCC